MKERLRTCRRLCYYTPRVVATVEVPKIKGLCFIEALKWYAKSRGQARIIQALAAVPAPLRVHVTNPSSPSLGLLPGS